MEYRSPDRQVDINSLLNPAGMSVLSEASASEPRDEPPIRQLTLAPISSRFDGPGPGAYDIPPLVGFYMHDFTKYREPAYTMRPITYKNFIETPGPGPAVYVDPRATHHGMYNAPAYTMRCACPPLPLYNYPGPPHYKYEVYPPFQEQRAPIYTMRMRTRYIPLFQTPAPNRYFLPEVMGRGQAFFPDDPGWTMLDRNEYYTFLKDLARSPGPAAHKIVNVDCYHLRAPKYTMRPKVRYPEPFSTPGPGAYRPEDVIVHKPGIPKLTFGNKHSPFAGAMVNRVNSRCRMIPKIRKTAKFC